jgi:2-polyprenyl-3-methyl-5-hydroxy-6-metoxy-1,4-benzoquinol methylase
MKKIQMLVKHLSFPGWDFGGRARRKLVRYFLSGNICTLDAGCGNGAFSLAAYALGNRVVGINIDPDQVRRCQEYGQYVGADGGRLHFRVFNIYDLRGLKKTFDQIICFETLEHLMRDKEVVQIFSDCLNPGGRLHLCTPNLQCLFNARVISKTEDGGHVRVGYTHEELEELMREAGIQPSARDTVGGYGCIKATAVQRWLSDRLWNRLPQSIGNACHLGSFILLYPLVLLDHVVPYPAWSVYVCGQK